LARSAPSLSTGASRSFFDGDPLGQALPPNMKGVRGTRVLLGLVRPFSPPELFALLIILLSRGILTAHHKLTADRICRFRRNAWLLPKAKAGNP